MLHEHFLCFHLNRKFMSLIHFESQTEMFIFFRLFVCLVMFFVCFSQAEISCLNEDGQPVDWFLIYKLPIYKMEVQGSGVEYMYLDPSFMNWQLSKHTVNSSKGALSKTMTQLYSRYTSNSSVYILYNDAPPELKYPSNYGHTKGVILFDQSQGFWITHSVPHFPPFPERDYSYPASGKYYGQTLHCITYSYTQLPQIYIYTGWVAQALDTDLLVESWLHKAHRLPSNCSLPRHVMNIKRVCLPGLQLFSSYEDHSKWCVSNAFKDQWTCLGDLNRDSGQAGRGGGLICSQNPVIYKAFRQAVAEYTYCYSKSETRSGD
ncbi:deoxyribonuclease-2-beta isoform X2 [Xyrauchen texanus]|uniref:deoxyribonuclease-2-beta isoform X2 n=1 Tax=Xyrauchen texanus TaxID=154827 RepID=UPI002241C6BF|nr:deoxyribonuclease-2-beta isoform X2 [Xyrauchen texanus]